MPDIYKAKLLFLEIVHSYWEYEGLSEATDALPQHCLENEKTTTYITQSFLTQWNKNSLKK